MGVDLSYDETVQVLQRSLVEATGNARGFAVRSRGRPKLVSARAWAELAEIEARFARDLADTVRLELRAEPWTFVTRTLAFYRGLWLGIQSEPSLVASLFRHAAEHPVDQWREGTPNLEGTLWPFFAARTHHLANTMALALDEPSPYPAIFWHPGRREFQS